MDEPCSALEQISTASEDLMMELKEGIDRIARTTEQAARCETLPFLHRRARRGAPSGGWGVTTRQVFTNHSDSRPRNTSPQGPDVEPHPLSRSGELPSSRYRPRRARDLVTARSTARSRRSARTGARRQW